MGGSKSNSILVGFRAHDKDCRSVVDDEVSVGSTGGVDFRDPELNRRRVVVFGRNAPHRDRMDECIGSGERFAPCHAEDDLSALRSLRSVDSDGVNGAIAQWTRGSRKGCQ